LTKVAQFLAVDWGDAVLPKRDLLKQFEKAQMPNFNDPNEPHRVLAELPLPLYLTTNYDDFMYQALLRNRNKSDVQRDLCRWNKAIKNKLKNQPSKLESAPERITHDSPAVYHLHGHNGYPESLVLTEDDYLDYLVSISREPALIPPRIQEAFSGTSLLFLGYRIADWNFRVLVRMLVSYMEISTRRAHISVQLEPSGNEQQREKARHYLDKYFDQLNIRVDWVSCAQFTSQLKSRWETFCPDR
jgi:hypothetical protein